LLNEYSAARGDVQHTGDERSYEESFYLEMPQWPFAQSFRPSFEQRPTM
jgi:hypothetical protein